MEEVLLVNCNRLNWLAVIRADQVQVAGARLQQINFVGLFHSQHIGVLECRLQLVDDSSASWVWTWELRSVYAMCVQCNKRYLHVAQLVFPFTAAELAQRRLDLGGAGDTREKE